MTERYFPQGLVLAQAVVEELRMRRIVLPPVLVIERVCAEVATRAQRHVHRALTESLTDEQWKTLDQLLESREGGSHSLLAWLRLPPGAPSARNILSHIERLQEIRSIGISVESGRKVHQNRLLRLAREGAQTAVLKIYGAFAKQDPKQFRTEVKRLKKLLKELPK